MKKTKGTKKTACRIKPCPNPTEAFELCQRHYAQMTRAVKSGKVTREKLEAAGLVAPRRSNPFVDGVTS